MAIYICEKPKKVAAVVKKPKVVAKPKKVKKED